MPLDAIPRRGRDLDDEGHAPSNVDSGLHRCGDRPCLPVCVYGAAVHAGAGTPVDRIGAPEVIAGDAARDRIPASGIITGDAARDRIGAAGVIAGDAARGTRTTALANERPGRASHQSSSEAQSSGVYKDRTAASRLEDRSWSGGWSDIDAATAIEPRPCHRPIRLNG